MSRGPHPRRPSRAVRASAVAPLRAWAVVMALVIGGSAGVGRLRPDHTSGPVERADRPAEVVAALQRANLTDEGDIALAVDVLLDVYRRRPVLSATFETPAGLDFPALALWSITAPDPNRLDLLDHRVVLRDLATYFGVFPLTPDVFGSVSAQLLAAGTPVNGPAIGQLAISLGPRAEALAAMGVFDLADPVPAAEALAWALTLPTDDPASVALRDHRAYYLWALDDLGTRNPSGEPDPEQ